MKKAIIIVVILLVVGLIAYKAYQIQNPSEFKSEEPAVTSANEPALLPTVPVATESVPVAENPVKISVTPPIGGTMKGVIEVGASGFNAFVVNIDTKKNWELVSKEFGASLAKEGFATEADIKNGLKKYLGSIFDKGVNGRNMHFVISSGALKNEKTVQIAKAIRAEGFIVNEVTPEQEGKYALRALLPKDYVSNSFVVDIGSGNTKISWYEGAALKSLEADGAKYYQDGKSDGDVYNKIVETIKKVPADKRQHCFIIGGVPFKLAQQSRIGEERYTTLASPDSYSAGEDVKIKSGLNIYRALQEGSGTDKFIFDWDANFTIGFLLTLN